MRASLERPGDDGVPALADRGRHPGLHLDQKCPRRSCGTARHRGHGGGRTWPGADRRLDPSLRQLARSEPHRQATLPDAGPRHAGGRRPLADLRHARARGDRGPGPAHRLDEPGQILPAPSPGPLHLITVLAGGRYRPQVLSADRVRCHAAHRDTGRLRFLGRIRTPGSPAGRRRADRGRDRDLVGRAPERAVPDAGDADDRRLHPAGRRPGHRRALSVHPLDALSPPAGQSALADLSGDLRRGEPLAGATLRHHPHAGRFRPRRPGALRRAARRGDRAGGAGRGTAGLRGRDRPCPRDRRPRQQRRTPA